VIGKMPSGAWMTSHGDSWIVSLWFFMYGVMQILKAPVHVRARMEEELVQRVINIIVYGDDHIITTERDDSVAYFNMTQFAQWCKTYLGVDIRDVRPDVSYTVHTRNGYKISEGIVFLRHNNVRNRHQDEHSSQPYYLPFRNMCDYQIKSVWGRECKDRDIYDFLLSVLGHAYGTYASNYNAYSWLYHAFAASMYTIEKEEGYAPEQTLGTAINRSHTNSDFMKKMKQADISMESLQRGFPSWNSLVEKNRYDELYHQDKRNDFIPR